MILDMYYLLIFCSSCF